MNAPVEAQATAGLPGSVGFVLYREDRLGTYISLHESADGAGDLLHDFVLSQWDSGLQEIALPADRNEAIEVFFALNEHDQLWSVNEVWMQP